MGGRRYLSIYNLTKYKIDKELLKIAKRKIHTPAENKWAKGLNILSPNGQ